MMFNSKSVLLQVLCLLPLGSAWSYHDFDSYVPFPDEAIGLLDDTVKTLKDQAPKVVQLLTFPGRDFFPHMQEVSVRNSYQNPLFMYEVDYLITDGLEMGCRAGGAAVNSVGRITDHVQADKDEIMCSKHCMQNGRYCPAHKMQTLAKETSHSGHDVMKETLRRVCLGATLENSFANPNWFIYLEGFKNKDCLMADGKNLNECSQTILDNFMPNVPTGEGSDFAKCLSEGADESTAIPVLEKALDFAHEQKKYDTSELPVMEIGEHKFSDGPRTDHILTAWCGHFTGEVKPIGCDFCQRCNNAKNCLWNLNCDGHMFDVKNYKDPKGTAANMNKGVAKDVQEMEAATEDAVKGTGSVLVGGIFIGLVIAAMMWAAVEFKRRKAVAEVAKEMPANGFRDGSGDGHEIA